MGTTLGRDRADDRPVGLRPAVADPSVRRRPSLPTWAFPLAAFAVWRLVHAVIVLAAGGSLIDTAFAFDAAYYLDIIHDGYVVTDPTYVDPQTLAFFPAFPVVAAPLVLLLGDSVGGTLDANLLAVVSFVAVWGAARRWYDERVARLAVITLACWPGSFYLWAFYSEGLFVTVTAGALWADRAGRFRLAVALVVMAGLTRSPGLLLGPVLAVTYLWSDRRRRADGGPTERPARRSVPPLAVAYGAASVVAAGVIVVIGQVVAGDPLAFSHAQKAWGREMSAPWVPMVDGVRHIVASLPGLAGETTLNLATTILFVAVGAGALVVAFRRRDDRPVTPALWTLAATVMPQFTLLLVSMVRLAVGAWTGFVLLALALRDRPVLRGALWLATAALSVVLLNRIAGGQFVA